MHRKAEEGGRSGHLLTDTPLSRLGAARRRLDPADPDELPVVTTGCPPPYRERAQHGAARVQSLTDLEGYGSLEQPEALKMRQRKAEP
jgi:hypothetical protein